MKAKIERDWFLEELPIGFIRELPTVDSPYLMTRILGIDSQEAKSLNARGIHDIFYYDWEQVAAGYDKVYGLLHLYTAAEDFTLPSGSNVKAGALIMEVTCLDMEKMTSTVAFEVI